MKKQIAVLLLLAVLAGSFVSCSDNAQESTPDNTADTPSSEAVSAETEPEEEEAIDVMAHLGERNFDGADFTVVGKGPGSGEWEMFEMNADDGITGEAINDAVFERNSYIAETYGVNLIGNPNDSYYDAFRNSVVAGTDDFQAALINVDGATGLAGQGILYDFRQLPYVELESPWYDQNANASLSVANRLFFSFGDMNLQNLDLTWCVMFNKQFAQNVNLGDLYALVDNNEWTMDKLFELSADNSLDKDGDGSFTPKDDWGMVTPFGRTALAFLYASDITFIEKDEKDVPVYAPLEEKAFSVFTKVLDFYFSNHNALNVNTLPGAWRESEQMFMNNQVLFYVECMQNLARFRDMEVDFGVLPMPKADAAQENYCSMVCNFPAALVIPSSCKNPEMTGFVVEAINAKSHETVRPAYLDMCLKYKYSRDEESTAMLNIVTDTMYYDPCYIYSWGGLTNNIESLAASGSDTLASKTSSMAKVIEKTINRTVENYAQAGVNP